MDISELKFEQNRNKNCNKIVVSTYLLYLPKLNAMLNLKSKLNPMLCLKKSKLNAMELE